MQQLPGPLTAHAVADGSVPVEHARTIAQLGLRSQRCVELTACPQRGEALLLAHAHLGLEEFRIFVKTWAYRADPDAAERGYRQASDDFDLQVSVSTEWAEVRGTCSQEIGVMLITALHAEIGTPAKDDRRSAGRRRHDALGTATGGAAGIGPADPGVGAAPAAVRRRPDPHRVRPGPAGPRRRSGAAHLHRPPPPGVER